MFKKIALALIAAFTITTAAQAVEGMWLPILLKKYNLEEMQAKGFKLTAEDIYDINNASLKDAVVGLVSVNSPFRHFCTGEVISSEGLILTNHHCGYRQIQRHSSVENDYLTNGFWAMSKEEELPNEGLGICFLKRMEDVTKQVNDGIDQNQDQQLIDSIIKARISDIEKKAIEGTHFVAKVKPFYAGNEYYLSVYEIFKDIRLVGAPPSAIGKFGGDTDNWMWPRHTGDFSMFRIYAGKDNLPADYAPENVPYKPIKHLKVSLDGIKKDDFTMVLGYPGTTQEYLPSYAVELTTQVVNPTRIKIRTEALNIMKADMEGNPKVRIQYSAKVAGLANGWKKWIGENKGLKRLDAINVKKNLEKDFAAWVNADDARKKEYGHILPKYEELYEKITPYEKDLTYLFETIYRAEIIKISANFAQLLKFTKEDDPESINNALEGLKKEKTKFFKDYNKPTDKKLFAALLSFYYNEVDVANHPAYFSVITEKYKGDVTAFTEMVFEKSIFCDESKVDEFIATYTVKSNKKLAKDPVVILYNDALPIYRQKLGPISKQLDAEITGLNKSYIKGIREFQSDKRLFPDANSTFRIAYGNVDAYEPRDGVDYHYQTTLKGIMQKDNPEIYDYDVPEALRELYRNKDYGNYANEEGELPVCFTASNHTTGGNSGSPVLNGNGELIGLNFDRNWEGTMSDIMYDPDMCRNIMLDVRYVLFIVDKLAGAKHLVEEMETVKTAAVEKVETPEMEIQE